MREERSLRARTDGEGGFALILAILALMLLTFLGLTMATTTSTELQISSNYRWSQQAQYNAEAGLEIGKSLLQTMNWSLVLPDARTTPSGSPSCVPDTANTRCWWGRTVVNGGTAIVVPATAPYSRNDAHGTPTRNYENGACDYHGNGVGYGVVLDDGGGFGPYQNVSTILGQTINGSFTLWVRRDLAYNQDGSFSDAPAPDLSLIMTAEGDAPFLAQGTSTTLSNVTRAVRNMEMTVSRTLTTPCGTRGGQIGGGPEGSNFSPCDPITGQSLTTALGGAARSENIGVQ